MKRFLWIIIPLVCLCLFIVLKPAEIGKIILENEQAYTTIANIYYDDYLTRGEERSAYSPAYDEGIVYCGSENGPVVLMLTEEEQRYGQIIRDTFLLDNREWDGVYVYDGFVSFCIIDGQESFVYSVDGKRPSYVNFPTEDKHFVGSKRINKNWFHMWEY